MRFIKSSWSGFEIDSSEFSAAIETRDVPRVVKAFIESPFIKEKFSFSGFKILYEVLESAKNSDQDKFSSISIGNKTLDEIFQNFTKKIETEFKNKAEEDQEQVDNLEVMLNKEGLEDITIYQKPLPTKLYRQIQTLEENDAIKLLKEHIKEKREEIPSNFNIESIKETHDWEYGWIYLDLETEEKLEIAIATKFFLQEFPQYTKQLKECHYTFYRKGAYDETAYKYIVTLTGVPHKYRMAWYESDRWRAVLESISKKAPIGWSEYD